MALVLQQAVASIQLNNYTAGTFVHRLASWWLISLSFPVVILTAVAYDYSK